MLVAAAAPRELCAPASAPSWGGDADRAFSPLTAGTLTLLASHIKPPQPECTPPGSKPYARPPPAPTDTSPSRFSRPDRALLRTQARVPQGSENGGHLTGQARLTGIWPGPLRTFCPRLLASYGGNAESLQEGPPAGPQKPEMLCSPSLDGNSGHGLGEGGGTREAWAPSWPTCLPAGGLGQSPHFSEPPCLHTLVGRSGWSRGVGGG